MKKTITKIFAALLTLACLTTLITGCGTGEIMNTEVFNLLKEENADSTSNEASAQWSVGFGQVTLPYPEESDDPIYIAGYNNAYEVTGILDEQRATAVWLDCGGEGILLIGIDCVGLSSKYVEDIRTDIAAECAEWGCAVVHIYATHTHAGIDTLGLWGEIAVDGKNPAFQQTVVEGAAEAARAAYANRRTGTLTYSKALTENMLRDSRDPQVYDENIYQLRFIPDDENADGVRIVSYIAHAESLRSRNSCISRDYPGVIADILKEETGDDMLYMPGAVGGLLMTRDFTEDPELEIYTYEENMLYTGRRLADYLLSIPETDEIPVEPAMTSARTVFTVPLDNTAFMYYRFLGILDNTAIPGESGTGYCMETELSIITLGDYMLTLIPGEIFPELVYGGYFDDTDATTPENENPTPLTEIAEAYGYKGENMLICGLANDEIGYIVAPNDFMLSDTAPYFDKTMDHKGENHYEETNSLGPKTATKIAEAFEETLKKLITKD